MPLIFSERWGTSTRVAVWSAEEDQDYFLDRLDLTADDLALVRSMHPRRALEWCASRYLLARMIGRERARRCTKDDHGKPVIPGDAIELSISHSYGMAAVIVSDRHRVGIDVQRQTSK
ncbi:MAG: hypothetical protein R3301_13680, partial [Saprospiraceae bacterium]|nr:hypothetical protein [Saprospiraceae bacterium]